MGLHFRNINMMDTHNAGGTQTQWTNTGKETDEPEKPKTEAQEYQENVLKWSDEVQAQWVDNLAGTLIQEMAAWADYNKQPRSYVENIFNSYYEPFIQQIVPSRLFKPREKEADRVYRNFVNNSRGMGEMNASRDEIMMGSKWYINTLEGNEALLNFARDYFNQFGLNLKPVSSYGSGRGSGSRGPSAADIRNQFDLEELARSVDDISRSLVLSGHKDPSGLARRYVDAVVAGKGEKKIDFASFVKADIEKTAKYKTIYAGKPDSVSAEQYIQPYFAAAMQILRPDNADEAAIGGAQFGASSEAFGARLGRSDEATSSAPYIQGLESRMRDLNSLFKG